LIDLSAPDLSGIEVDGTSKVVDVQTAKPSANRHITCDPVATAWIIVERDVLNVDVGSAEPIHGLLSNGSPANVQRLIVRNSAASRSVFAPVPRAVIRHPDSTVI
jgi:hypothetical protein